MCRPWKLGGTSAESQKWLSGPTAGLAPCWSSHDRRHRRPPQARPRCSYRDQPCGSLDGRTRPRGLPLLLPLLGSCPRSAGPGWSLGKDGRAPAPGRSAARPLWEAARNGPDPGGPPVPSDALGDPDGRGRGGLATTRGEPLPEPEASPAEHEHVNGCFNPRVPGGPITHAG